MSFEDIPEDFQESYPCFKIDDGGGVCMGDIIEHQGEWNCQTCGFNPNEAKYGPRPQDCIGMVVGNIRACNPVTR
jgi:hypothetical protein